MTKIHIYGLSRELLVSCSPISHKKFARQYHNQLKNVASLQGYVALASNQIGEAHKGFVMLAGNRLVKDKWANYSNLKQSQFMTVFNPRIEDHSEEHQEGWEECPSYPGIRLLIRRSRAIKCAYANEFLKEFNGYAFEGFSSRIFQQKYDHLQGRDLLSQALEISILSQQLKGQYQGQINSGLRDYHAETAEGQKQELFRKLRQLVVYSVIDKSK